MIRIVMKRPRIVVSLITAENDARSNSPLPPRTPRAAWGADVQILFADGDSIEQSQQILRFVQAEELSGPTE